MSVSWFHPDGRSYVASLFTSDGSGTLFGVSHDNLVEGEGGLSVAHLRLDHHQVSRRAIRAADARCGDGVARPVLRIVDARRPQRSLRRGRLPGGWR